MKQFKKKRKDAFKALDDFREAFKDVTDKKLEQEITKAVKLARTKLRKFGSK